METCSKTAQLRKTLSWSLYIPPNLTPTPRKSDMSNLSRDDRGLSEAPHSLRMTINLNLFVGLKSNGDKSDDDAPKIINILARIGTLILYSVCLDMYLQLSLLFHFPIHPFATCLACHLHYLLRLKQLLSYDPLASLWSHTTLHSGLPSVGAGHRHRNPAEGIFRELSFLYKSTKSLNLALMQYPQFALVHRSFTSYW